MGYNNYNRGFEINEEKTADFLVNAVEKITTEEDIDTLTELIRLFKKNVPLSRRKYVTAYMLKDALKHYHSFGKTKANRFSAAKNKKERMITKLQLVKKEALKEQIKPLQQKQKSDHAIQE